MGNMSKLTDEKMIADPVFLPSARPWRPTLWDRIKEWARGWLKEFG